MKRILFLTIPLAVITLLAQQGQAPRPTAESVSDPAMRNITGTFSSGRIADVAVDPRNRSVWYVPRRAAGFGRQRITVSVSSRSSMTADRIRWVA